MTIRSRYTAAITDKPWWLAGGIPASACVAAYQAKGASSLGASYTNLANPSYQSLSVNTNAPTFNASTGWEFNGTDQRLYVVPNISMIIRFSDAEASSTQYDGICGYRPSSGDANGYRFMPNYSGCKVSIGGAGLSGAITPSITNGVLAGVHGRTAGNYFYVNGVEFLINSTDSGSDIGYYIGGHYQFTNIYSQVKIQALALYDIMINPYIAVLTNAMNAL